MNPQIQLPTLSRTNKVLISVYVGLFILSSILTKSAGISLLSIFGLSYQGVTSGLIFQLVTFPLIDTGFTSVLLIPFLFGS